MESGGGFSLFHISSEDSIIILLKVNQFSRLRVGAEVFGSTHSPRYIRLANVLSQLMTIQPISIPVKFNSFSNIRYNCQKVLQHIRWLLSDGMIRQMTIEVDFIVK